MRLYTAQLSTLMLALLLVGCAAPVSSNIKPSETNIAKYNELSALDVVTALEKNVEDAKAADMPFLAPHYYREAAQLLSESQAGLSNKPKDQLVQQAARGDAILDKGRSIMSIVAYRFVKELELKTKLEKLNTSKLLPKEYEKLLGEFSGLIEKVEREKPDNIDKDKEALIRNLQDLEIKAVQEGALRESETINAESKTKNAEKQIPATYAEAIRAFQDAKTQIAAAPHDSELVVRLGTQALFSAHHAQQLNDRVVDLQAQLKGGNAPALAVGGIAGARINAQIGGTPAVEKGTIEKIVLLEEERLLGISTALGQTDLRDLSLEKQVKELQRAAADSAVKAKNEAGIAAMRDLDARLNSANEETQKALAQLAEKDKQITDQTAQIAEKEAQIVKLNEQITELENNGKSKHK